MSIAYHRRRRVAAMGDSCTILRPRLLDDGAGSTYPHPDGPEHIGPFVCSFSLASGREVQIADVLQQRGSYRLALPVDLRNPATDEPFAVQATDQVEVLGAVYNVVWNPPVTAQALDQSVGLEEAA